MLARVWCRFDMQGRRRDTKMFTLASTLFEGGGFAQSAACRVLCIGDN